MTGTNGARPGILTAAEMGVETLRVATGSLVLVLGVLPTCATNGSQFSHARRAPRAGHRRARLRRDWASPLCSPTCRRTTETF